MADDRPLVGKVALVTGGDRGIGKAIALRLAKMGADIAITYRKRAEEAAEALREMESEGVRAVSVQADLGVAEQAIEAVRAVRARLGPVSILVNNAGVGFASPFEESFRTANTYIHRVLTVMFLINLVRALVFVAFSSSSFSSAKVYPT